MKDLKEPRIRIAPSLLSADFGRLKEQIAMVEDGGADLLHLDIMDGHFVPNLSFGVPVIEKIRGYSELYFDTHVMITDPYKYAEPFIKAGSNNYTFHIEATNEPRKVIDHVRGLNCDVGIALNPDTPFRDIEPMISEVDVVLVMSVWPGFGGQRFIAEVLPKAAEISRNLRPDQRLEFDGGIDFQTVGSAAENGADTFVAGFAIFSASDPVAAMARIREAAQASKAAGGDVPGFV